MFLSFSSHSPSFVFPEPQILDCVWISYLRDFPQILIISLHSLNCPTPRHADTISWPGTVLKPLPQFACICVTRTLKYKDGKYLTIAIRIIFQLLPVRYVITCIFPAIHPVVCWEESFISESYRTFLVHYFVILCFSICHTMFLSRL